MSDNYSGFLDQDFALCYDVSNYMMQNDEKTPIDSEKQHSPEENNLMKASLSRHWSEIWDKLVRLGLGETILKVGTGIGSIILALLVLWVMGNYYLKGNKNNTPKNVEAAPIVQSTPNVELKQFDIYYSGAYREGLFRLVQPHTVMPEKPRTEIITYTVQKGDTIFDIAKRYNLRPETILWGNYYVLADDPHRLKPEQKLNILPVDGVLHDWHAGEGLNGVAKYYGVTPEDIINWPGNHLSKETVGDYVKPNIKVGTLLIVPNGHREFVTWSAPRITRSNPAVAKILGPGSCGTVGDGPVGIGIFIWPTDSHYLSGFDYSPETNHWGIDLAGSLGVAIYASDNGVVVYAGWNDWGYGNMVVIDHGNGWQSVYAHLSALNVVCGSGVYQGTVIGAMGSTGNSSGPHLHYELRSDEYGRANPWNFLPK